MPPNPSRNHRSSASQEATTATAPRETRAVSRPREAPGTVAMDEKLRVHKHHHHHHPHHKSRGSNSLDNKDYDIEMPTTNKAKSASTQHSDSHHQHHHKTKHHHHHHNHHRHENSGSYETMQDDVEMQVSASTEPERAQSNSLSSTAALSATSRNQRHSTTGQNQTVSHAEKDIVSAAPELPWIRQRKNQLVLLGIFILVVGAIVGIIIPLSSKSDPTPSRPPNDICQGAIGPLSIPSSTDGSTALATISYVSECGTTFRESNGVWYSIVGNGRLLSVSTCTSAIGRFEAHVAVFAGGNGCASLQCIDDSGNDCSVSWISKTDDRYYVFVYGVSGETGDFRLKVEDLGSTWCPSSQFETQVNVTFTGNPDNLTPQEISALEESFVSTYNGLADNFCDPYFRAIEAAEVLGGPIKVSNGDGRFLQQGSREDYLLTTKATGSCGTNDAISQRLGLFKHTSRQRDLSVSSEHARFMRETDPCECPSDVEEREPKEEDFLVAYDQAVSSLNLPNVDDVDSVDEPNKCPFSAFETQVTVTFTGDPDNLTPEEIYILEQAFVASYNDLADKLQVCDPYSRAIQKAESLGPPMAVNGEGRNLQPSSRAFYLILKVLGICRGNEEVCEGLGAFKPSSGRRDLSSLSHQDRRLQVDPCVCPPGTESEPTEEEFLVEYEQAVSSQSLAHVDGVEDVDESSVEPTPPPTIESSRASSLRTCVAVIDESDSFPDSYFDTEWATFRSTYPERPFCLLRPDSGSDRLYRPASFDSDPLTIFSIVNRDEGIVADRSDWFDVCDLDNIQAGITSIALFVDNSGSMYTSTVQASYDLFLQKLADKGLGVITREDDGEDWITPFTGELA